MTYEKSHCIFAVEINEVLNKNFRIMKTLNKIGIEINVANDLAIQLNDLLANYQMYYQNLRGFHWNIKGEKFFELHEKFEELYNDALIKIDEIAERILTLGYTPQHTFSAYLEASEINEAKDISKGVAAVSVTLDNMSVLVKRERSILNLASEAGDEGTVTLMSDYITQQEKVIWMLSAFLS